MKIRTHCPCCDKVNYVNVNIEGFYKWQEENMPIQFALPELDPSEREMLKTGICPTCWDKMWSEDTEEDENLEEWDEEEDWEDWEDREDDLDNDLEDVFNLLINEDEEDPDIDPECNFVPEPEEVVASLATIIIMATMLPRK